MDGKTATRRQQAEQRKSACCETLLKTGNLCRLVVLTNLQELPNSHTKTCWICPSPLAHTTINSKLYNWDDIQEVSEDYDIIRTTWWNQEPLRVFLNTQLEATGLSGLASWLLLLLGSYRWVCAWMSCEEIHECTVSKLVLAWIITVWV